MRFKKEATTQGTDPKTGFFLTDRPRAERALSGGRERGATTRGPIFWQVLPMLYLAVGLAVGHLLWSLSCPLLSSSFLLSLVCSNPLATHLITGCAMFSFFVVYHVLF